MFNALCELVGCPCDPGKASSSMSVLGFLGASIRINFIQWAYEHRIMPEKAVKWSAELEDFVLSGVLPPGQAAKIVGKLSFAVQLAHGRFGRAFLRPLIRCIHARLSGNRVSAWTARIIQWWIDTLRSTAVEWQIVRVESPPEHLGVRSASLHPYVTETWWYRGPMPHPRQ
jgi:hypothetical protein